MNRILLLLNANLYWIMRFRFPYLFHHHLFYHPYINLILISMTQLKINEYKLFRLNNIKYERKISKLIHLFRFPFIIIYMEYSMYYFL